MRRLHADQHGFTLTELLAAIAITAILMIGVMTFLVNTIANNSVDTARADLLREAQLSLDIMTRDIRLSASVDSSNRWEDDNSPNAPSTGGFGWESDDDTLILATAAEDANDNILFQDISHYITYKNNVVYFLSDGSLYRRTIAGDIANNSATTSCPADEETPACPADRELVKHVSDFTVRYLDGDDLEVEASLARSVEVTLDLSREKYGRTIDATYSTRTVFRNE
jgi:prepilin-type N-terminal cleavage/methylation domain-containing protein